MVTFKIPYDLQSAMAKVVGLDATQLTRIVIDIPADAAPRFRVSGYLSAEQCDRLTRIVEATEFKGVD